MPCFDPREVMFITNQWDIIEKYEHSSDDEDDENSIKDDQHAITWNKIQDKLKKEWDYYDVNNVFRVSLKQIIKEKDAKTGDAKEMGKCAEESIDKGAEKADNFSDEYNRFVTMLKATIDKNKNKRVSTTTGKIKLERYKPFIIDKLTTKLNNYLHSSKGREDILNDPGAIEISEVQFKEIQDEVHSRFLDMQ
ncbi:unnamed protein product [Mytilus edulis]|uniref:Uncharacterized protein n=1 Tax=Mytilus edulis TaxID=6550 RepID=A0A8S3SFZ8_MYTED|nr:unnamed protein product [Mytilus edulis]